LNSILGAYYSYILDETITRLLINLINSQSQQLKSEQLYNKSTISELKNSRVL